MQNSNNQQSIVRTDFTLKYLQLESELKEHQLLQITGVDTKVFIRSWMNYSLAKGDKIVPWLAGDFSVLLKTFSQIFKESIQDGAALRQYIIDNLLTSSLIFAVNSSNVESSQLNMLLDLLKSVEQAESANSSVSSTELNEEPENSIEQSDQQALDTASAASLSKENEPVASEKFNLQAAGQTPSSTLVNANHQYLSKVIIWLPNEIDHLTNYAAVLALFSQRMDIGGKKAPEIKKSKLLFGSKTSVAAIAVFIMAGTGLVFWSANSDDEDSSNSSSGPQLVSSSTNNTDQAASAGSENKNALTDVKIVAKAAEIAIEPGNSASTASATLSSTKPQKSNVSSEESIAVEKRSSGESDLVDKSVVSPANLTSEQANKLEPQVDNRKSEQVEISNVSNSKVINLRAKINTGQQVASDTANSQAASEKELTKKQSNEQQIIALVDNWLNAWQTQNFGAYKDQYSADFSAKNNSSHSAWLAQRKKRIERPKWIKLFRTDLNFLPSSDSAKQRLNFTLTYSTPTYKDKTFKQLTVERLSDGYKIVKEENLKVTRIK